MRRIRTKRQATRNKRQGRRFFPLVPCFLSLVPKKEDVAMNTKIIKRGTIFSIITVLVVVFGALGGFSPPWFDTVFGKSELFGREFRYIAVCVISTVRFLDPFSENWRERFSFEIVEEHGAAGFAAQAPHFSHSHSAHNFDELRVP